ncbi:MAG: ArsC family transcriptional regulator [Planctomycetota bacterium]|nr:MAG: ArsC family transcriptional regulator [Planctomycetota bacterium]
MGMKVYEYNRCSTCRKALKYLDDKGVDYKALDITEQAPSVAELKKMLKFYDGDIKRLFNTSGVQYRELKMKDKIKTIKKDDALKLLSGNGKLVKRPFLIDKDFGIVGFKEDEWANHF